MQCATERRGKSKARQYNNYVLDGGNNKMLEAIRTFFGRSRGGHGERRTVVQEGLVWRCTKCYLIFTTKSAGDQHDCKDNYGK